MKQVKILWLVAALFCATTAFGKDIKTVVFRTTPEMHCKNYSRLRHEWTGILSRQKP